MAERKPFPAASPRCGLEIKAPFLSKAPAAAPVSEGTGSAPPLPHPSQHHEVPRGSQPLALPAATSTSASPGHPTGRDTPEILRVTNRCRKPSNPAPHIQQPRWLLHCNPLGCSTLHQGWMEPEAGGRCSQLSVTPKRLGQLYLYVWINIHKAELKRQSQLLSEALQLLLPADPPRHARSL